MNFETSLRLHSEIWAVFASESHSQKNFLDAYKERSNSSVESLFALLVIAMTSNIHLAFVSALTTRKNSSRNSCFGLLIMSRTTSSASLVIYFITLKSLACKVSGFASRCWTLILSSLNSLRSIFRSVIALVRKQFWVKRRYIIIGSIS